MKEHIFCRKKHEFYSYGVKKAFHQYIYRNQLQSLQQINRMDLGKI